MIMGKWEKSCQKNIILDQVFERPPEVSQSEIEGGGGGEVFLEEEIVHTNVQRLESQVSGFFFGGGRGTKSTARNYWNVWKNLESDEWDCCGRHGLINTQSWITWEWSWTSTCRYKGAILSRRGRESGLSF